jgi:hypothetical protein
LQHFPNDADVLEITRGRAFLVKKDIFKNLMWYTLPDSTKQYPLTLKRVQEIKAMNREGKRPDDLQAVEVVSGKPREVEPEFVDVVGQISLRSLEKTSRRQREKERGENEGRGRGQGQGRGQGNQQQQQRPPQQRPPQQNQQRPPQEGGGQNKRPPQQGGGQGNNQQRRNRPPRDNRPPKQEGS